MSFCLMNSTPPSWPKPPALLCQDDAELTHSDSSSPFLSFPVCPFCSPSFLLQPCLLNRGILVFLSWGKGGIRIDCLKEAHELRAKCLCIWLNGFKRRLLAVPQVTPGFLIQQLFKESAPLPYLVFDINKNTYFEVMICTAGEGVKFSYSIWAGHFLFPFSVSPALWSLPLPPGNPCFHPCPIHIHSQMCISGIY